MKTKLLPCPFCGGKARFISDGMNWYKGVECRKCEHNIYFFKKGNNVSCTGNDLTDKIEIGKYWNSRVKIAKGKPKKADSIKRTGRARK